MNNSQIKYLIVSLFIISFLIFSFSVFTVLSDSSEPEEVNTTLTQDEFYDEYVDFYIQLEKFDFVTNDSKQKISNQHLQQNGILLNENLQPNTPFEDISNTILFGTYTNESKHSIITQINKTNEEINTVLDNQTDITQTHDGNVIYLENSEFDFEYVTKISDRYIVLSNDESYVNALIDSDNYINIPNSTINNNTDTLLEFEHVKTKYNNTLSHIKNSENNHDLITNLSESPNPESLKLYKKDSKLVYNQKFSTLVAASRFNLMLENYGNSNTDIALNRQNVNINYSLQKESFNEYIKNISNYQYEPDIITIEEHNEFITVTISDENEYDEINIIHNNEIIQNINDTSEAKTIELENQNYSFEGISENGTTTDINTSEDTESITDSNEENESSNEEQNDTENESEEIDEEDVEETTKISKEEKDGNITITIEENEHVEEFILIDPDAMSQTIGSNIGNSEEFIKPEEGEYRIIGILDDGSEQVIKTIN